MTVDMVSLRVKSNAKYTCQECGSTEFIQGHHQIPRDDSTIIPLCADCHSKKHPDVPVRSFFNKSHQPYWENISAASLARQLGKHPRTIYRIAKKLGITKGVLSDEAKTAIVNGLTHRMYSEPSPVYVFKCLRCEHEWASRNQRPLRCAKCKTPYWDKPRRIKKP